MSKIVTFFKSKKEECIRLLISLGLLMLSAVIGIFIALKETNGLNRYVNEAYEYYRDSNWMALYNYAELTDDDFINEYFFENMASSIYGEIDESLLKLGKVEDDGDKAEAKLTYKGESSENATWSIKLKKTSERKYLFFYRWKLDIDDFILRDCTITVPEGCTAYVDGVELTAENSEKTTDDAGKTDTYTIPKIFMGSHTVNVAGDILDVSDAGVSWIEDNSSYIITSDEFAVLPSERDKLEENAGAIIQNMYAAVFSEAGVDGLSGYFIQDEVAKAKIQTVYDDLLAAITPEDGSTLNSMNITSFAEADITLDYPSKANVSVTFECTFSARGARSEGGGVREKYDGTASSTVTFHFVKEGENWLCDDFNMQCIDYSKKEVEEE